MSVNHESALSGHLGAKKTEVRILPNFFWPGHQYILTLVDYATRYPEAVPLKKISTEAVAEALLDIYIRLGIPEEVLTDQGTQFMSECMEEVSRLLSIKGLTSMPYYPICNRLVER